MNTGTQRAEDPRGHGAPTLTVLTAHRPGKRERHALRALSAERALRCLVQTAEAVNGSRPLVDGTLSGLATAYNDGADRERMDKAARSARDRAVQRVATLCTDAGRLCDPKIREEAARQMDAADRSRAIARYDAAVEAATKLGLLRDKLATYGAGASTDAIRKATRKVRAMVTLAS